MNINNIIEYEGTPNAVFMLLEIEDEGDKQLAMLYARTGTLEIENKVEDADFHYLKYTKTRNCKITIPIIKMINSDALFKIREVKSIDEYRSIVQVVKDLV